MLEAVVTIVDDYGNIYSNLVVYLRRRREIYLLKNPHIQVKTENTGEDAPNSVNDLFEVADIDI